MIFTFSGSAFFRQRILLATLSGKPIKIEHIRSDDENPGLRDFEIQFLKLVEKLTNGSSVEINYTGINVHCYGTCTHIILVRYGCCV